MCFIFLRSRGFEYFKYDMDMDMSDMVVMDMDVLDTKTNTNTKTKTKTNTKCFKDPMYAIFLKISGFKDFKYDMDMDMSDMKDMDMVEMDIVDMDRQGLGPKGSSVDSILSFFYRQTHWHPWTPSERLRMTTLKTKSIQTRGKSLCT